MQLFKKMIALNRNHKVKLHSAGAFSAEEGNKGKVLGRPVATPL